MALTLEDFNETLFFVFGSQKYVWEFVRSQKEEADNTIGFVRSLHGTREQCNVELIDGKIYFYTIIVSVVVSSKEIDLSDYNKVEHIKIL